MGFISLILFTKPPAGRARHMQTVRAASKHSLSSRPSCELRLLTSGFSLATTAWTRGERGAPSSARVPSQHSRARSTHSIGEVRQVRPRGGKAAWAAGWPGAWHRLPGSADRSSY